MNPKPRRITPMSDVHISNRTHAADSNDAPSVQARKPYTPPARVDLSAQATQGKIYSTKEATGYFGIVGVS